MDDQKRKEIRELVLHFKGQKKVSQKVLEEYCTRNKIELVAEGDYQDYLFQMEDDERVSKLLPEILTALTKLQHIKELGTKKEIEAAREANNDVRIEIAKLLEKYAIPYRMLDPTAQSIAERLHATVSQAGTTIGNKAAGVLLHLAEQHFGGTFDTKKVADYADEVYGEAKKKVEAEKAEAETADPVKEESHEDTKESENTEGATGDGGGA